MRCLCGLIAALALSAVSPALAKERPQAANHTTNSPDEPLAKKFSLAKSAEFLDDIALNWTRERKCGTCHTNYVYLIARPALKEKPSAAWTEVQQFFVHRATNWDSGKKDDKPRWDAEVVATAVTLAFTDAQTTGKLQPATRKALDKMWTLQKKDGGWNWLK